MPLKLKPKSKGRIYNRPFKVPSPDLSGWVRKIKGKRTSVEVTFPVSYRYNGGISIGEDWYPGYEVGAPIVPKGYKLISLGVGLQLNARPPYATMLLKRIDPEPPKKPDAFLMGLSAKDRKQCLKMRKANRPDMDTASPREDIAD
jgi:hypothetical protein